MTAEPIRIWPFHDAPEEFQRLSPHCGDEDWVAHVPSYLPNDLPGFLTRTATSADYPEYGTHFGISGFSTHILEDASLVLIGAHA